MFVLPSLTSGTSLPVDDSTSLVRDPVDNTKQTRVDTGAVATGTTRVLTMPDNDVDLGSDFASGSHTHTISDVTDISAFAATVLDDADAQAARTTLGAASQSDVDAITTNYSRRRGVKDRVDNTLAPPTEVTGDRYLLDDTVGTVHSNWDGASANDIVEFDGSSWVATSPVEGYVTHNDADGNDWLYTDDGSPSWDARTTGGAPVEATYLVTSAHASLTNEVVVSALTANLTIAGDDVSGRTITIGQGLTNPDTVKLKGIVDAGEADSFEIPSGSSITADASGEIQVQTGITDHTGLIVYHDGAETLYAVAIPTGNLTTVDGHVPKYNATNNEFEMGEVSAVGIDAGSAIDLTISTGAVTVTPGRLHYIDTESAANSDFLDTINGLSEGECCILASKDNARSVIIRHAIGNIRTYHGADGGNNGGTVMLLSRRRPVMACYLHGQVCLIGGERQHGEPGYAGSDLPDANDDEDAGWSNFSMLFAQAADNNADRLNICVQADAGNAKWLELDRLEQANEQAGAFTLDFGHRHCVIPCNFSSEFDVTVPTNASVPFRIMTQITLYQTSSGAANAVGDTGVTVRKPNGGKTAGQYKVITLLKVGTDEWTVVGDATT